MAHFYALPEDIHPVLAKVEARHDLLYTLTGTFGSVDIPSFRSGRMLPTLTAPPLESAALNCPAYLVTPGQHPVRPRKTEPRAGGPSWAIDQLANADSTVLWLGGIYANEVLLPGRVATVSKSQTALRLQRAFDTQIRKHFKRIQSFYVGPRAEHLLDEGFRLAPTLRSPAQYDLRRESASAA